jgi:hypothetical protein
MSYLVDYDGTYMGDGGLLMFPNGYEDFINKVNDVLETDFDPEDVVWEEFKRVGDVLELQEDAGLDENWVSFVDIDWIESAFYHITESVKARKKINTVQELIEHFDLDHKRLHIDCCREEMPYKIFMQSPFTRPDFALFHIELDSSNDGPPIFAYAMGQNSKGDLAFFTIFDDPDYISDWYGEE